VVEIGEGVDASCPSVPLEMGVAGGLVTEWNAACRGLLGVVGCDWLGPFSVVGHCKSFGFGGLRGSAAEASCRSRLDHHSANGRF
jgi:hypothetical protein